MNRRVLILLLLVLVVVVVGGALYVLNQQAPAPTTTTTGSAGGQAAPVITGPTATPITFTKIVVAVQELPRGMRLPPTVIQDGVPYNPAAELRDWPSTAALPQHVLTDLNQLNEKIVRTDIGREEPILDTLLVDDLTQIAKNGSDAAAVIPQGLRAISVPMDRLTGIAYALQDGDYVDVIISFLFVDVDPTFQTLKPNKLSVLTIRPDGSIEFSPPVQGELQPSNFTQGPVLVQPIEAQRPRLVTQTTVQAAYVIHVGNFPLGGASFLNHATPLPTPTEPEGAPTKAAPPPTPTPPIPDIVTLAVSPQAAVELAWAIESRIPLTLVLRNARDTAPNPTTAVTLQYMIEQYQVAQPPALPYALEPALRSIRSLVIGNVVSLESGATTAGQ